MMNFAGREGNADRDDGWFDPAEGQDAGGDTERIRHVKTKQTVYT